MTADQPDTLIDGQPHDTIAFEDLQSIKVVLEAAGYDLDINFAEGTFTVRPHDDSGETSADDTLTWAEQWLLATARQGDSLPADEAKRLLGLDDTDADTGEDTDAELDAAATDDAVDAADDPPTADDTDTADREDVDDRIRSMVEAMRHTNQEISDELGVDLARKPSGTTTSRTRLLTRKRTTV